MYLTEKEILVKQQEQLFGIQKIMKSCQLSLDDITEIIPGLVHLNKIQTLDLAYLDRQSREKLEISPEEIAHKGKEVLSRIVKPESFEHAKRLFGKKTFDNPTEVVSHFQALKGFFTENEYEWFYSVKKHFNDDLIITISNPLSTLGEMQKQVEKILEENVFLKKNLPKINSLTGREKEIIKLIFKGNNSVQIAEILFISPHTVRTHRKNILRKLEINSYTELLKFAGEFDLV